MQNILLLCLLPLAAFAAPGRVEQRDLPSHTPVNVKDLDSDFDVKCVTGSSILKAVSWGVNLQRADQQVGRDGGSQYPHYYGNDQSQANPQPGRFKFPNADCNKYPQNLRNEFPITKDGTYEGGDEGLYRAIYLHDKNSDTDIEGNPTAYYCGTIYHSGDNFEGCDVTKN
ncbi:uncharacterized protein J7T55_002637 [Diaporthe amygdali]|uniref:uncharacterized protein n=1 Tax=Phomopsis amygdali TaxID=1214568 RepID=UPI0022FE6528|nr:uncharacterized protein J7T55_002637 [Diaporthe amygdali]KAJ0122125.1 uncharacterized protein J7T55_002637 [Diaporthe amygdali]